MNGKTRKLICMLLAGMMTVSMTACGGNSEATDDTQTGNNSGSQQGEVPSYMNKEGLPICNETITVTVAGPQGSTPDWNDTHMVEEFEKQMGIKMECSTFADDAWQTQLTLMMSSDDLPDMIANGTVSLGDMSNYGMDGYFLPINEYLDTYGPNINRYFEEYPIYKSSLTSSDGNIYGLARITTNKIALVSRTFINETWLKNVGKEYPKTVDELYDVLKAFKEQDANGNGDPNDEIPFSDLLSGSSVGYAERTLAAAFGIFSDKTTYILQEQDGKVVLGDITENYKEYLKYLHRLYEENLLDPECFIQTLDEFRAKAKEDRVGFFGDAAPFVAAGQPISYDQEFQWVGGLTSSVNDTPTVPLDNQVATTVTTAISASTKYPEALVRLVDYLYSEEGMQTGSRGFEGITFSYEEIPEVPGSQNAVMFQPEGYASDEEFRYKKAVINNGFQVLSPSEGTQYQAIMDATDEQLEAILPKYGWAVRIEQRLRDPDIELVNSFPNLIYTPEEREEQLTLYNDISLYLGNAKAQFITGEVDIDAGWENHIQTLKQMNLERLLEIEQAAYDRMK